MPPLINGESEYWNKKIIIIIKKIRNEKRKRKKVRPFQSVRGSRKQTPNTHNLWGERAMTMAIVETIVGIVLVMILLILLLIVIFCKPWRFFFSSASSSRSRSRTIKVHLLLAYYYFCLILLLLEAFLEFSSRALFFFFSSSKCNALFGCWESKENKKDLENLEFFVTFWKPRFWLVVFCILFCERNASYLGF